MMDILLIVIAGTAISTQLGGYTDIVSREVRNRSYTLLIS